MRNALLLFAFGCRGGDTLDQPNDPPVWPLENVRTDALPHAGDAPRAPAEAVPAPGATPELQGQPAEAPVVAPTTPAPAVDPAPVEPPVEGTER